MSIPVREGIYVSDRPFRLYKRHFRLHKRFMVWDVACVSEMSHLYKRQVSLRLLKYLPFTVYIVKWPVQPDIEFQGLVLYL